jgi:hypothetical protein
MIGIFLLTAVTFVDGDIIRLDGEHVRLVGIDASEIQYAYARRIIDDLEFNRSRNKRARMVVSEFVGNLKVG